MILRQCPGCEKRNRIPASHLTATARCGGCKQPLPPVDHPVNVGEVDFDTLVSSAGVPVLVDFWAEWCGPCKMAAPELEKLASRCAGEMLVAKVNTEQEPGLALRFNIRGIPYFAVFQGGELKADKAGLMPASELERLVRSVG